ncbi:MULTISPECIES: 4a-hydroxytetrahydrobiopterin dehydratase [Marinobacter]|uniref:Putative pterin-4-alpha-carbinolamine dehydratase n=1 Tax=Marinobacter segnicrescens TaxID=430453 RepID=A0A1H9YMA2_9GAMM|nr:MULTISPECIES: 4a-hydroxytetrahydrobiopterin dehydratase [Marinobacter]UZD64307.1 4a-hydroxytetrahydrobiopterin dehydratase [Marinobacter sp. AN1]SES69729.1 4a-hydroxytetrahydrobiopterin dehydratase [Marinobacter segnicrescens]
MKRLGEQNCEACRADAPQVSAEEQDSLLMELPNWEVVHQEGVPQLRRVYSFRNFVQGQAFTNRVADLAEAEGHHPAILLEYGKVTVRWWTHKIGGLHRNDFIMAARTDAIYEV